MQVPASHWQPFVLHTHASLMNHHNRYGVHIAIPLHNRHCCVDGNLAQPLEDFGRQTFWSRSSGQSV